MSTAKESGLKVQQIFSYFKPNGKLEGDITPEDFGAAMHKLGWKCTDEQLKTLLDDFDATDLMCSIPSLATQAAHAPAATSLPASDTNRLICRSGIPVCARARLRNSINASLVDSDAGLFSSPRMHGRT